MTANRNVFCFKSGKDQFFDKQKSFANTRSLPMIYAFSTDLKTFSMCCVYVRVISFREIWLKFL